jgi:hypothetical protein
MRLARAESLQWFGLFGAALIWTLQLVIGFGLTVARCSAGGVRWGIDLHTWEILLMAIGAAVAVSGEAAALSVFLALRDVEHDGPPPLGRRHFFAAGAAVGNVLFIVIILLSGIGVIVHSPCHQA